MESIDGGHRSRAILNFFNGKFPLHRSSILGEVYYDDLSEVQKEWFLNFPMRLVVYKHLSPQEKQDVWFTTNNGSALNRQEARNGVGFTPGSNIVRYISREIGAVSNTVPHALFAAHEKYLTFNHTGMTIDTATARIVYIILYGNSGPFPCDDEQLDRLYQAVDLKDDEIQKADSKTKKLLDYVLAICKARYEKDRTKTKLEEFVNIWRCYFSWSKDRGEYGKGWRVNPNRWTDLYVEFATANVRLSANNPGDEYTNVMVDTKYLRWQKYNSNSSKFSTEKHWLENVEWLGHVGFNFDRLVELGILVDLDKNRSITRDERYELMVNSGWKEPITGKPLTIDNSHAGHKVAHSRGGKSSKENTVVLTKETNLRQGTKAWDEFALELEKEVKSKSKGSNKNGK
jgi:hypothetical protein